MPNTFEMSDGNIRIWIEQEAIHLRVVDAHGDPIELTVEEAKVLAGALLRIAEDMEKSF